MIYIWSILLICIGDVYGKSCFGRILECGGMPEDFPKTVEELEKGCIGLQTQAKCILAETENCNDFEDEEEREEYVIIAIQLRKFLHFLKVSCDPESELFQVASQNVECAYTVLESTDAECYFDETSEDRRNAAIDYSRILMGEEESLAINICISGVWTVSCTASLVSDKCGSKTLQPMAEILTGVNYLIQRFCTQDIIDEIPSFVEAVAAAEHQAEAAKNGI